MTMTEKLGETLVDLNTEGRSYHVVTGTQCAIMSAIDTGNTTTDVADLFASLSGTSVETLMTDNSSEVRNVLRWHVQKAPKGECKKHSHRVILEGVKVKLERFEGYDDERNVDSLNTPKQYGYAMLMRSALGLTLAVRAAKVAMGKARQEARQGNPDAGKTQGAIQKALNAHAPAVAAAAKTLSDGEATTTEG